MPYKDPEKQREYNRKWIAKRRKDWFDKNGPCNKCGSWNNLELDHIDRTTKVSHNIWSWEKTRREIELSKCQVLCEKCHLDKTISELSTEITHGTERGWKKGCREECCHQALLIYWRERRKNKKDIS